MISLIDNIISIRSEKVATDRKNIEKSKGVLSDIDFSKREQNFTSFFVFVAQKYCKELSHASHRDYFNNYFFYCDSHA